MGTATVILVAAETMGTPVVWIEAPERNRRDMSKYKLHVIHDVPHNCWTAVLSDIDGDGDLDIALAESDADHENAQGRGRRSLAGESRHG